MKLGVHTLPRFPRDATDRNRTSPFAFTGNKFEFRMLGSSNSIACSNMMLNTAVAQSLKEYADRLEQAGEDKNQALHDLIREVVRKHKRIIFNGNGYDEAWIREATQERGLLNLRTTPDCVPCLLNEKNTALLTGHKVFSPAELRSRCEIMLESYTKTVSIEALTMIDMARKEILPAVEEYTASIASAAAAKRAVAAGITCGYEAGLVTKLSRLTDQIAQRTDELELAMVHLGDENEVPAQANYVRDEILPRMCSLRAAADEAETLTAKKYWPFPSYGELLFGVR